MNSVDEVLALCLELDLEKKNNPATTRVMKAEQLLRKNRSFWTTTKTCSNNSSSNSSNIARKTCLILFSFFSFLNKERFRPHSSSFGGAQYHRQ